MPCGENPPSRRRIEVTWEDTSWSCRTALDLADTSHRWERLMCLFCHCYQVDPEELTLVYNLRKLMRNDWVRIQKNTPKPFKIITTAWEYVISDFPPPLNVLFLVSAWWCHHHHSLSDGFTLHLEICLLASRAAGRGQSSFYCTRLSPAPALKCRLQMRLSFSSLTLVISQDFADLTSSVQAGSSIALPFGSRGQTCLTFIRHNGYVLSLLYGESLNFMF